MGTHACSRSLTFPACLRSPPQLSSSPSLSKPGTTMSCGGGRVGGDGRDDNKKPTPPPGVHPRYIPRRGGVLKRIFRGMLGLISPLIIAPASPGAGGRRVRPAPGGEGGDGAEQGK